MTGAFLPRAVSLPQQGTARGFGDGDACRRSLFGIAYPRGSWPRGLCLGGSVCWAKSLDKRLGVADDALCRCIARDMDQPGRAPTGANFVALRQAAWRTDRT